MRQHLKNILLIYFVFLTRVFVFSQNSEVSRTLQLKQIVYTLASDSMQGRAAGSIGALKAEKYLVGYYKEIGLAPLNGTYIQTFVFSQDSLHIDTAMNLIGLIDNKADSCIVIGAHYDHIGLGGARSRSLTNKKVHPGADDNASGVAVLLMLAEYLKKSELIGYNYYIVAFSAEEDGLFGSQNFIDKNKPSNIKLMINFDMVGRLDSISPKLKVTRNTNLNYLDSTLIIAANRKLKLIISDEKVLSDASAFEKNNIPSISYTTGSHDDYHKISDTADKINYRGLNEIIEYVFRVISLEKKIK